MPRSAPESTTAAIVSDLRRRRQSAASMNARREGRTRPARPNVVARARHAAASARSWRRRDCRAGRSRNHDRRDADPRCARSSSSCLVLLSSRHSDRALLLGRAVIVHGIRCRKLTSRRAQHYFNAQDLPRQEQQGGSTPCLGHRRPRPPRLRPDENPPGAKTDLNHVFILCSPSTYGGRHQCQNKHLRQ